MAEVLEWARTSPVLVLLVTVVGYLLGRRLREATGGHPLAQPVLVAIAAVAVTIAVLGIDYDRYLDQVSLLTFWLGPATVALAVPLHRQAHRLQGFAVPLVLLMLGGALISVTSAVLLGRAFGADEVLQRTLAPKAATTPVSIALSHDFGGIPAISASLTILIGILGAVAAPALLSIARIRDPRARGLAIGAVSHGIGTSRALHDSPIEGAFSGLAMGLTALATSLVLPLLVLLLF